MGQKPWNPLLFARTKNWDGCGWPNEQHPLPTFGSSTHEHESDHSLLFQVELIVGGTPAENQRRQQKPPSHRVPQAFPHFLHHHFVGRPTIHLFSTSFTSCLSNLNSKDWTWNGHASSSISIPKQGHSMD